jgi:hypothetical protein
MLSDELDRVLDEAYLGDVSALTDEELKARRVDCQNVEAKVSYVRRLVQGRLDIVAAERDRRASGAPAGDLSTLVERLPEILADRVRAPGPGRMPTNLAPPDDEDLTGELDAIGGTHALGSLPELSDEELEGVAGQLAELERRVSGQRRAIFHVIDALQDELTARYQSDDATR